MPLISIDRLEIWGHSTEQYSYDGCLCLKLEFSGDVVGVVEFMETLVLVCPYPVIKGGVSIVVGTNTSIVRRLFQCYRTQGGDHCLSTFSVYPAIKRAYECSQELSDGLAQTKKGTVWFTGN